MGRRVGGGITRDLPVMPFILITPRVFQARAGVISARISVEFVQGSACEDFVPLGVLGKAPLLLYGVVAASLAILQAGRELHRRVLAMSLFRVECVMTQRLEAL